MKTFATLFASALCLVSVSASADGEKWSEDGSADYGEFGLSYYQESGRPSVVFYSSQDKSGAVYCLRFEEQFEASPFTNGDDYEEVSNSKVQYSNLDWAYEVGNATNGDAFDYRIYAPASASGSAEEGRMDAIEFVFHRVEVTTSEGTKAEAVKFDINIDGYTWAATGDELANVSFVIEFKLDDCSDQYGDEREDSTDSTDDDEADSTPSRKLALHKMKRASLVGRRRLSGDSDDGISSDDSHEYDLDLAFFTVAETATAEGGGDVSVDLFYGDGNEKLFIRFDYFGASVELDPTAGTRSSSTSAAPATVAAWAAATVALAAAMLQ